MNMDFRDDETEKYAINTTMKIRIEDFHSAYDRVGKEHRYHHSLVVQSIYTAVYPDGVDRDTEGWLVVLPNVDVTPGWNPEVEFLSWIVSIIDVKGNSKLPRSFQECPFDVDFQHERYLERSFILNRADEFLPDDVLTLRCDIYLTWNNIKNGWAGCTYEDTRKEKEQLKLLNNFLSSIPKTTVKNDSESENPSDFCTVYDFTQQILILPQFHGSRKRFGVYGIGPAFGWPRQRSRPNSPQISDNWENVWIFDIFPDRFFLLLDENQECVGSRLMKASPVITRCINAPMKEKREKRMKLYNVDSQAFIVILFFLEKGIFPPSKFNELVDVYKISHFYEMEELQQKCAQHLVKNLEFPTDFEELERIASIYSDEYLSTLLDISCADDIYPLLFGRRLNVKDRPDFACFF